MNKHPMFINECGHPLTSFYGTIFVFGQITDVYFVQRDDPTGWWVCLRTGKGGSYSSIPLYSLLTKTAVVGDSAKKVNDYMNDSRLLVSCFLDFQGMVEQESITRMIQSAHKRAFDIIDEYQPDKYKLNNRTFVL